ncbi:MAG: cytochrome b [Chloroflexota bacterium]
MSTTSLPPPTRAPLPKHASAPEQPDQRTGWLEQRLDLHAFYLKYGRKVFPVHHTFFLGEMAAFSFLILVITGVYLGLIYTPSNAEIDVSGQRLPQAYASVLLIDSIPVASLLRTVHHWTAHVMVASVVLHAVRVFLSGSYRKPREVNWVVGVVLLGLTLMAGFVGYALPYDAFAVTATGIGYSLARSIPVVGAVAADLFFGGTFPTLGSLPRLYTIHVVVVPTLISLLLAGHLVMVLKQKHTQPGYARPIAEPGRVLGVPLWPYQAILAGQLLLLLLGGLFFLSAFVPIHPVALYGPPGPNTPDVKPDWYLLWIYGFLKLVPNSAVLTIGPVTIGPEFVGGLLFPAAIFGLVTLAPWLDRTNRGPRGAWYEYLEPIRQAPLRFALGIGLLVYLGMLFVAAYYDTLGLTLVETWLATVLVPVVSGVCAYGWARRASSRDRHFDPTAEQAATGVPTIANPTSPGPVTPSSTRS